MHEEEEESGEQVLEVGSMKPTDSKLHTHTSGKMRSVRMSPMTRQQDVWSEEVRAPRLQAPKDPHTWLALTLTAMQMHRSRLRIGPIDMSCAFSVSDARQADMPLIYCSPMFERTTHYTLGEIKGRNHRFMQDPDGVQEEGQYRKHTDNEAVREMMETLKIGKESQVSLSNYIKGSHRWTNLLTMIPIVLNTEGIVDFVVGLQLNTDIFSQSVTRALDGTWEVDYRMILPVPRPLKLFPEEEEVASIRHLIMYPDEYHEHWSRFLRNEVVDTILMLSKQGVILEISRSVWNLLGLQPDVLIGDHLSTIMHPADIVPLMQELHKAEPNSPLSLLARMKHRTGFFKWIEFTGSSYHLDEGTTDEVRIVLSGRQRSFLSGTDFGGVPHENECWARISPDGIILFATRQASRIFGAPQAQIFGCHFFDIISRDDLDHFREALDNARKGHTAYVRHDCIPRDTTNGETLKCASAIYPGSDQDAQQTFLLVRTSALHDSLGLQAARPLQSSKQVPLPPPSTPQESTRKLSFQPIAVSTLLELVSTGSKAWSADLNEAKQINLQLRQALVAARARKNRRDGTSASPEKGHTAQASQCGLCNAVETTQWRTGPRGTRLCNSCGLSWRKSMRSGGSNVDVWQGAR